MDVLEWADVDENTSNINCYGNGIIWELVGMQLSEFEYF